ncbi:MAG: hypothetical protein F4020_04445 [Gammaproteobacteria bacterium]|nr:hypothetical protein [Gammaproteobacteria bacterium]MYK68816.1 hypothetical protein [Gammaproteobacteria bacterium]
MVRARTPLRGWGRAGALFVATLMFSVFGPLVLVLIPFACLVFSSPAKRALPVMAGALGMVVALAGVTRSGLWYVERGWTIILGGCFAAVTLRWPERKFLPRALLALAISGAGAWAALGLSPRRWAIIDGMVAARLRDGVSTSLEALRVLRDGTPLPGTVITTVFQAAEWQSNLFPAMLGLSSLAALGTAWWIYVRLVRGSGEGLGELRDFRFDDQLVWLLVAGAALFIVQPDGAAGRVGLNLLAFMGALYALRGAGVAVTLTRGVSALGWVLLALAFLLLAPFLFAAALLIGLSDTWMDIRARARRT